MVFVLVRVIWDVVVGYRAGFVHGDHVAEVRVVDGVFVLVVWFG